MRSLTRANSVARQCLADEGTELGIADVADVTHECAYSTQTSGSGEWLYPCAMQVPGTQHILDTIFKDSVERLCWWHAWERDAKAVCQWLHKKLHRDFFTGSLDRRSDGHDQYSKCRLREVCPLALEDVADRDK
jgi:hypothetical protein